ncbi:Cysteine protease atg4b [Dinochytrium kinnereticum]|nr:Cysteine protease atg4b [Dinochytrium kinnereticum]
MDRGGGVETDNDSSLWEQFKSGVSSLISAAAESFRQISDRSPGGDEVWLLGNKYSGVKDEAFLEDFASKLWMTYRHSYPPIKPSGYTADVGWGCMLRSGQMMLSNAFLLHLLGRGRVVISGLEKKTELVQ